MTALPHQHRQVIVFFLLLFFLNKVLKWSDREETLRIQFFPPLLIWPEREASFAPGLARTVAQEAHRGLSNSTGGAVVGTKSHHSFVAGSRETQQLCLTWL